MALPLRPSRGGFLRPFGCGQFIRAYLGGEGLYGSPVIDPNRGAPIDDVRSGYKEALLHTHAEDRVAVALGRCIELSLAEALRRIPHRLTKVRSHSFYRLSPAGRAASIESSGPTTPSRPSTTTPPSSARGRSAGATGPVLSPEQSGSSSYLQKA